MNGFYRWRTEPSEARTPPSQPETPIEPFELWLPPNMFPDIDSWDRDRMRIVIPRLGHGLNGITKGVRFPNKKSTFALKTISKNEIDELRDGRENALREIFVQRELSHPNLVKLLVAYEDADNIYIVTELCHGGNLHRSLRNSLPPHFDEAKTKNLAWMIARGIKHLHDNKIVHRDIKPENIFLTRKGVPKIGDFGSAKILTGNELYRGAAGTTSHWPPEAWQDLPQSFPVDIWAFGVVIYTLLHDFHPFRFGSMSDRGIEHDVVYGSVKFLILYPLTESLKGLIQGMLRKLPSERYTIDQVIAHPWFDDIRYTEFAEEVELECNLFRCF